MIKKFVIALASAVVVLAVIPATVLAQTTEAASPELDPASLGRSDTELVAKGAGAITCNTGGYHCVGLASDMIDHIYVDRNQAYRIYVSDALSTEMANQGVDTTCSLYQGVFIQVSWNEQTAEATAALRETIDTAIETNALIALRVLQASYYDTTCALAYVRYYI